MPHTIGKYTVAYDRSAKLWQTMNGSLIATFPPGQEGKTQAVDRAIHEANPALHQHLHRLIDRYPDLTSRAYKAAAMLINDSIQNAAPGVPTALVDVRSQSQPDTSYTIQKRECLVCPCDDYQEVYADRVPSIWVQGTEQKMCKHILTLLFATKLGYVEVS